MAIRLLRRLLPPEQRTKPIPHDRDPWLNPDVWTEIPQLTDEEEAALHEKQMVVNQKIEADIPLKEEELIAAGWKMRVSYPAMDQRHEPSQAATSAPSSSAGSDRQPPALPPSSSTTQTRNGGSTFCGCIKRRHSRPNVEVAEAPPPAHRPSGPCIICGASWFSPILKSCDHCNETICLEHSRSCWNFRFTQPSKRVRTTRYGCGGLFCPNHELLHDCPAPIDIINEGIDI